MHGKLFYRLYTTNLFIGIFSGLIYANILASIEAKI
jgi:hypothetical protein